MWAYSYAMGPYTTTVREGVYTIMLCGLLFQSPGEVMHLTSFALREWPSNSAQSESRTIPYLHTKCYPNNAPKSLHKMSDTKLAVDVQTRTIIECLCNRHDEIKWSFKYHGCCG